jgi:hypothetical protein
VNRNLLRLSTVASAAAVTAIVTAQAAVAVTIPYGAGPQTTYTVQAQPAAGSCTYRYVDKTAGKVLPDASCNPGARNPDVTQSTIGSTICVSGYTTSIRPPSSITDKEKAADAKSYSFTGTYGEYDHLIPLELGGDPNDARNLWVEPNKSGATSYNNPKDSVETKLKTLVCNGSITLSAAQQAIVTDWTTALATVGYPNA